MNEFNPLDAYNRSLMSATFNSPRINPAKWTYEKVVEYIKDFENELDQEHEVAVRLVNLGSVLVLYIEDLGYAGPDIISFHGKLDDGSSAQLVQHVTQLSFLLISVKKQKSQPRRIGFINSQETE